MDLPITFITLGVLFLLGLGTDALGRRTRLPRVTLLLVLGALLGPWLLALSPAAKTGSLAAIAHVALVLIGFLLGEKLTPASLREGGRLVLWISLSTVAVTAVVVGVGLLLVGVSPPVALILAGIATATAPAATTDVVHEAAADGPFSQTLLGIVAIDDAWGLIAFSMLLAVALGMVGDGAPVQVLLSGAREIGGALLLGVLLGVPAAYLTGRVRPGEPTLVEALGIVFLCLGIALWFAVSTLLSAIVLGAVVASLARHHTRPFHAIEQIEWPFMIVFFVLAGASLEISAVGSIGLAGAAYVILRTLGRLLGGWLGGALARADPVVRRWMGAALLPHAGVALGAALVVQQRAPELAAVVLPVVVAATVVFEIVGPILTRRTLERAGELSDSHTAQ